jgi:hypothetical protein
MGRSFLVACALGLGFAGLGFAVPSAGAAEQPLHAQLAAVSCLSPTSCIAVGHYDNKTGATRALAERWNGSSWTLQATPDRSDAADSALTAVACPSANLCIAVGWYQVKTVDWAFAEVWNGTAWKLQSIPQRSGAGGDQLLAVSCPTASACTAVGNYYDTAAKQYRALASVWNGTKWSNELPANGLGGTELDAVSCPTTASCTAVGEGNPASGGYQFAESSSGTRWTGTLTKIVTLGELTGVSCTATTSCVAVGDDHAGKALAQSWNGTSWTLTEVDSTGPESAVSCVSASACSVVGDAINEGQIGNAYAFGAAWNGTSWDPVTTAAPARGVTDSLAAVSCTSATSCVAVGWQDSNPESTSSDETLAESWNGTAWTAESTPNPD